MYIENIDFFWVFKCPFYRPMDRPPFSWKIKRLVV